MQFPSDIEDKILKYMKDPTRIPFPEICAEACGVPRSYFRVWLKAGQGGDRRYAGFAREVAKIVANYVERLVKEIQDEEISSSLRQAKLFLLQRLERETFDPPKAETKSKPAPEGPSVPAADLQAAAAFLSEPARH